VGDYKLSYDVCFKVDKEFSARVLGALDLAFFQLCDSCFHAASISDVEFGKTCLLNLREDILGNRFKPTSWFILSLLTRRHVIKMMMM